MMSLISGMFMGLFIQGYTTHTLFVDDPKSPYKLVKQIYDTVYVAKEDTTWLDKNKFITKTLIIDTITIIINIDTIYQKIR
jgi:hypothetical protein